MVLLEASIATTQRYAAYPDDHKLLIRSQHSKLQNVILNIKSIW
jgi:hypothetical protein